MNDLLGPRDDVFRGHLMLGFIYHPEVAIGKFIKQIEHIFEGEINIKTHHIVSVCVHVNPCEIL